MAFDFRGWNKRNRKAIERTISFVIALASAVVISLAFLDINALARLDTLIRDLQIADLTPPEAQDSKIVIADIDEDTLSKFEYRSPINRGFIAGLLVALAAKHPRAIGLDILLDTPTDQELDEKLKWVLVNLKIPIAVSYSTNSSVLGGSNAFLDSMVPARDRAFATLASDKQDVVRWIYPGERGPDGHFIPSFPHALAQKVGVKTPRDQVAIVWHGQPEADQPAFAEYPAQLVPVLPETFFRNKIVLIGSDLSLTDRHSTPFDVVTSRDRGQLPGIVVQAHALSQLLEHKAPREVGWITNLVIALALALVGVVFGAVEWPLWLRIGVASAFVVLFWVVGGWFVFVYLGKAIDLIVPTLSLALSLWATESLTGLEARRQRAFIQDAFGRYVSPKVVERLVHDPDKLSIEGERRVMTFIFTDIEGFTTMSEMVDGHELQVMLNTYLEAMTECVMRYDGTVDKFIGDAVMAIFNAPLDQPDHGRQAVLCALEMDRFSEEFHLAQKARGISWGITRIGVHTGAAVIGNFGSKSKFSYTAQGDAVNTASRLEGLNKTFGTRMAVSDATKQLCPDIDFRPIAAVTLKGKTREIDVWEPLHPGHGREDFLARYQIAYDRLEAGDPKALEMFEALHAELPGDPCVALHLERLRAGETGVAVTQHEK